MRKSLTRQFRLRSPQEITSVFSRGSSFSTRGMRMVSMSNGLDFTRIVVIPARGFSNAVTRNRSRRQVREAYRNLRPQINTGYDLAVVVYPGETDFQVRNQQLTTLLKRAGLMSPVVKEH